MELFTDKRPLTLFLESFGTSEVFVEGLVVFFLGEPSGALVVSLAKDGASAIVVRWRVPMTSQASQNSPSLGIPERLKGPVSSSFRGALSPRVNAHGFSKISAIFGFFLRSSTPFGMYKNEFPKPIGEATREHLTRIDSIKLLMAFEMWRAIALVGTESILKKFKRCSGRARIGG